MCNFNFEQKLSDLHAIDTVCKGSAIEDKNILRLNEQEKLMKLKQRTLNPQ